MTTRTQTKPSHTPGPLIVSGTHLTNERTGVVFAEVCSPSAFDPEERQRLANAAELCRRWNSYPALLAACEAVAGVFADAEDPPLYARRCIAAIAAARHEET